MSRILSFIVIALLFGASVSAQSLESPKRTPVPPTDAQNKLIKEGVVLHDRNDFDGAIAKYEEVLKENPDCVDALYEESFSQFQKKDYKKSVEISYKAATYKSDLLPQIYVQLGSGLDELGDFRKAIDTYKAGIKMYPNNNLLHFNLGITYTRLKQLDDARAELKRAALLNPGHQGTQRTLSKVFWTGDYKIPALLAACRFLVLEPDTPRSDDVLQIVQQIMEANVTRDKDPNKINIFVDMNPTKKDEGDFDSAGMFLGLMKGTNFTEENKGKSEIQLLTGNFQSLFAYLGEGKADKSHFATKYYVPYFSALKQKGFVEPFCYYINQRTKMKGVNEWLAANQAKVHDFLEWSLQYKWPSS